MGDIERRSSRPDPSFGIFETMRVRDGVPEDLADHLDRLRESLDVLGWPFLRDRCVEQVEVASAAVEGDGRVRLEVRPSGESTATAESVDRTNLVTLREEGVVLRPVIVPGGLGARKWVDRRCLDGIAVGDDDEALLLDEDLTVLETGRGNLFMVRASGVLVTAPDDGRILPGVTRRAVIDATAAAESKFSFDELCGAAGILVTGTVRGVLWVREIEGFATFARPEIHALVSAQLAWL